MNLNILPLTMEYEINDVIFFVKCIKQPSKYFNINDFVSFSSSNTRSSSSSGTLFQGITILVIYILTDSQDCGTPFRV